jgi:single-stranded DNA-binding protein
MIIAMYQDKRYRESGASQNGEKRCSFPNVNRVVIAGKLIDEPPVRYTRRGIAVTNFLIETLPEDNFPEIAEQPRKTCQVSIVAWAQQALQCNKYLKKGDAVLVMGELQSMPNAAPDKGFLAVQVKAQWIQYLDKSRHNQPLPEEFEQGENFMSDGIQEY